MSISDKQLNFKQTVNESYTKVRNKRFTAEDIQIPKFHRLDPPNGRNVFVELGIIVDQVSMTLLSFSCILYF